MNFVYSRTNKQSIDCNVSADMSFRREIQGQYSMACREQGSHARGVYPAQDTSSIETARAKQEEEAVTGIIARV